MAQFILICVLSLVWVPFSLAHFLVTTPAPLGNNIENEDTPPCGGYTPSSSDKKADFHVKAYRGMLGSDLSKPNWTNLLPTVEQFGLNGFCEQDILVPSSWAGSSGLLQIIQDAEDGVHYQCMAVNFVSGKGTTPSTCTNSSGVSAQFAADATLSAAESGSSSSSAIATSTQGGSSTPSAKASPTASNSAALSSNALEHMGSGLLGGLLAVLLVSLH